MTNLVTDTNGTTRLNGTIASATNNITFNDNVTVANNISFSASNLTFRNPLNPIAASTFSIDFNTPNNLTLTSIGATTLFANITANSDSTIFLSGTIGATTMSPLMAIWSFWLQPRSQARIIRSSTAPSMGCKI